MRRTLAVLGAALAAVTALPALAQGQDPNLGRNLAAGCANCHGTGGISQGTTESLAGMKKEDLVRKMQEFKSGAKPSTIMQQLTKGYTDEQVDLIAVWFATQPPAK